MAAIKKRFKVTVLFFKEDSYYPQNGGNVSFLGQNQHSKLVSKPLHCVFLKLFQIAGIKKWASAADVNFEWKFILCSKWSANGSSFRLGTPLLIILNYVKYSRTANYFHCFIVHILVSYAFKYIYG